MTDENAPQPVEQPAQPAPEQKAEPKAEKEQKPSLFQRAREQREQNKAPRISMKERWAQWMRVLQIARKPTKDEFVTSSKVSAGGIVIIGAIGLAIFLVFIGIGI